MKNIIIFTYFFLITKLIYANIYYVSTDGKPYNNGSYNTPFNIDTAFSNLNPGDTYIFKPGNYYYDKLKIINCNNDNNPITLLSEKLHEAKIIFKWNSTKDNIEKIRIEESTVIFKGFELTQTNQGDIFTHDAIIKIFNSNNCKIIDNIIHGAGDDGIKLSQNTRNTSIKRNIIHNIKSNGIDIFNCENNRVAGNYIYNCAENILVKGGSRNIKVYNNLIVSNINDEYQSQKGISFGGTSNVKRHQIWRNLYGKDYEAYSCVAYNNIIIGKGINNYKHGALRSIGSYNCGYFNNTIVNVFKAFKTYKALESKKSIWQWQPTVHKPIFKNNIIYNCNIAYDLNHLSNGWEQTHNAFYNIKTNSSIEYSKSNKFDDPLFVDNQSNWHLKPESPYIISDEHFGLKIDFFLGYYNKKISISNDKDGIIRKNQWKRGAYQSSN